MPDLIEGAQFTSFTSIKVQKLTQKPQLRKKKKPTGLSRPKKKNKKEGKRNAEDADNAASSAEDADSASARAAPPKAGGKKTKKKAPVIADTYDQVKKMKDKTGYVVGEAVDAKHYKVLSLLAFLAQTYKY